jgi:hypothetical protein
VPCCALSDQVLTSDMPFPSPLACIQCSGSDLCDWLLVKGFSTNRAEAVVFCNLLLFQKFLINLSHNVLEGKFTDDEEGLYRVDDRCALEQQVCVCVCGCIYICVCGCMCACERECMYVDTFVDTMC